MSTTAEGQRKLTLEIGGMTCASCAMRIEKKLNKLDGVHATVNYALERAAVTAPPSVSVAELVKATYTSTISLVDHGLSMLVFVICLIEFIVVGAVVIIAVLIDQSRDLIIGRGRGG